MEFFETKSGLVIPRSDSMRIIQPGEFALEPSLDRDEELLRIVAELEELVQMIHVCFIHCFDGRPFWRMLWRMIIKVMEAEKVLRMSLAGAAASTETYLAYLDRLRNALRQAKELMKILHIVITHDPCGRFSGLEPRMIALKGTLLARKLINSGRLALAIHFHLDLENGVEVWIDDYMGIAEKNPLAKRIVKAANDANGLKPEGEDLADLPNLEIIKTTMAMGYPPQPESNTLVLCEADPAELRKSIVTARRLKGSPPTVDPVAFYYNEL